MKPKFFLRTAFFYLFFFSWASNASLIRLADLCQKKKGPPSRPQNAQAARDLAQKQTDHYWESGRHAKEVEGTESEQRRYKKKKKKLEQWQRTNASASHTNVPNRPVNPASKGALQRGMAQKIRYWVKGVSRPEFSDFEIKSWVKSYAEYKKLLQDYTETRHMNYFNYKQMSDALKNFKKNKNEQDKVYISYYVYEDGAPILKEEYIGKEALQLRVENLRKGQWDRFDANSKPRSVNNNLDLRGLHRAQALNRARLERLHTDLAKYLSAKAGVQRIQPFELTIDGSKRQFDHVSLMQYIEGLLNDADLEPPLRDKLAILDYDINAERAFYYGTAKHDPSVESMNEGFWDPDDFDLEHTARVAPALAAKRLLYQKRYWLILTMGPSLLAYLLPEENEEYLIDEALLQSYKLRFKNTDEVLENIAATYLEDEERYRKFAQMYLEDLFPDFKKNFKLNESDQVEYAENADPVLLKVVEKLYDLRANALKEYEDQQKLSNPLMNLAPSKE